MDDRCREALHDLQTYLDGECGRSLDAVIRQHLGDCSPCLDRADFERELRAIVANRCKDAAPSGLVERVLAQLQAREPATGDEPGTG